VADIVVHLLVLLDYCVCVLGAVPTARAAVKRLGDHPTLNNSRWCGRNLPGGGD